VKTEIRKVLGRQIVGGNGIEEYVNGGGHLIITEI